MRLLPLVTFVLVGTLAAGCSCGIDSSKIDALQGCGDDSDCPSWQICERGYCVDRPCETDEDCPADAICAEDGYCGPGEGTDCQADGDCDDGTFCNGVEACVDGACGAGDAVDCSDLDDLCNVGSCDESAGACEAMPLDADGDGHAPTMCGGEDCDDARDDVNPDEIEGESGPEDATCTDGVDNDCDGPIDGDDTACVSCDSPEDCDDDNPCTDDSCESPRCVNDPDDTNLPPDDGATCTVESCVGGDEVRTPNDAPCADASDCTTEICDPLDPDAAPATGCVTTDRAAAAVCDDDDACTVGDACDGAGACVPGDPPDVDGDGFADEACGGTDCDDDDADVRPDVIEGETGPDDPTCSNTIDDDCDGRIDVADVGCVACDGPEDCVDGLACTSDLCDGVRCSNPIVAGQCLIGGVCFGSGTANPLNVCQECTPGVSQVAWTNNADPCDDGATCTHTDTCAAGACSGTAYSCVDGLACTSDVCNGAGGCTNAVTAGNCLITGACRALGDLNPGNPCQECIPGTSQVAWSNDDTNVPADAMDCTDDTCLAGVASHAPDDAACAGAEVCAPCAGGDGCILPPSLSISCTTPGAPGAAGTPCTVDLGAAGMASCLSCSSLVGMTSLLLEDFDGCPDLAAEGWTVAGDTPTCPEDVSVMPDAAVAEDALEADDATWTIDRFFDTTDFDQVRLCFDHADDGAGGGDSVAAYANAGAGWVQIFLETGSPLGGTGSDGVWHRNCVDVDAAVPAAADNANLGIRFTVISGGGGRDEYLDRIALDAWDSGYLNFPAPAVSSNFTACSTAGWAIGGPGAPICPVVGGAFGGRDALEADDNDWSISRDVDASALCEDIWVNFTTGTSGTSADDLFQLLYDPGAGYTVAWAYTTRAVMDNTTTTIAFSLSHLDPDVRFDPALGVRFRLDSNGASDSMILDDVVISGATCDPGDGLVTLETPVDAGGGDYTFDVQTDVQTTTYVECVWDGRPSVADRARIEFLN